MTTLLLLCDVLSHQHTFNPSIGFERGGTSDAIGNIATLLSDNDDVGPESGLLNLEQPL